MNGLKHMKVNGWGRTLGQGLLCGLLTLGLARTGLATVDTYQNDAVLSYTVPPQPIPTIDATNFINNNSFTINFATFSSQQYAFYEPRNVINYVNNGDMTVNSGFQFDTLPSNNTHAMAGSFYNGGNINCASITDTTGVFFFNGQFSGSSFATFAGQFIVSATNIVNPGTVIVGVDGLMRLTGQNVDLSRSTLTMEGFGTSTTFGNLGTLGLASATGTDTNAEWVPSSALKLTSAFSSLPASLNLTNSTAYIQVTGTGTTNVVVRAVFLSNPSPNVTNNVYFDSGGFGLGSGNVTIEWLGFYVDSASGQTITNFLYLNDDYLLGASTNVFVVNGVPDNFTFNSSPTQISTGTPAVSGFPTGFAFNPPFLTVTNTYSYVNAQLVSSTVSTNAGQANPSGALTNLPGRIYITGTKDLNLALAQITGGNYLSLTATNQFDGSPGAHIVSPYSDINIGVTNGFLTVSNLLEASIPNWSGTIQAWSARWLYTDANGTNYDYRVLLVNSQISPISASQVQDLILHGTNTVISDVLNVFRTLSMDAQSLTLTTNGYGVGAGSPDGELNYGPSVGALGASQIPNLRWLTNNGAIRIANLATFGSSSAVYGAFINNSLLSDSGTTLWTTNFVNAGTITNGSGSFLLQSQTTTLTNSSIFAGASISITANNLLASNTVLRAGQSFTLQVTNLLTDTGVTSSNFWLVGSTNGNGGAGFILTNKPLTGDLLGTTISNYVPAIKAVANVWAGQDRGVSAAGYTNNVALGRLILDALSSSSQFKFSGIGASNALYVDYLELRDSATNFDGSGNLSVLNLNTNFVIYYAQAMMNGFSVAEKINHKNGNRLRWVPMYAGYFSSTNLVYTNGASITTNTFNAALVQSQNIDSDGDGTVNASDPTPIFVPSSLNFSLTVTNLPPLTALIKWQTLAGSTNTLYYRTNLTAANWLVLTNFVAPSSSPVTVFDPVNLTIPHFYRIQLNPNSTQLYGP